MKHIQNITQATNQFIVALHRKDVAVLYHTKHAYNKTPAASMLCKGCQIYTYNKIGKTNMRINATDEPNKSSIHSSIK